MDVGRGAMCWARIQVARDFLHYGELELEELRRGGI
jgi:hypothetical protein